MNGKLLSGIYGGKTKRDCLEKVEMAYNSICQEAYLGCELSKDGGIFFKGERGLGACISGGERCLEKTVKLITILKIISKLKIKPPYC